jgi:hypothetical protein
MSNSKAALLEQLHALLTAEFLDQIESGTLVAINGPDGRSIERTSPPASVLNAARAFLHDNHIDINSSKLNKESPILKLAANLESGSPLADSGMELPEFEQ